MSSAGRDSIFSEPCPLRIAHLCGYTSHFTSIPQWCTEQLVLGGGGFRSRARVSSSHDQHRAVGVVEQILTHRTQECPQDRAAAARAHRNDQGVLGQSVQGPAR